MKAMTKKEGEVLLLLCKDFGKNYNANSISKAIDITPRGALKILKNLKEGNMLASKIFGNATFYKINFDDYYTFRRIETLLIQEAQENASRWISEFEGLFEIAEIVVIFGSAARGQKKANDVDLLIVISEKNFEAAKKIIREKNKILLRPIHPVYQSPNDIKNNLKKKQPVLINALKQGYVLHGYEKLIEVIKNVTSF